VQSCTLDPRLESNAGFEASIIKVYSSILLFQVQAALYFHRSTMTRVVSNIVKLVEWRNLLSNIRKDDYNCVATASMIGIAHTGSFISDIHGSLLDMKQKCEEIHDISKVLHKFREDWEKKQTSNAGIVSWVSDVPVGEEHERVRAKLGARYWDAGQWFYRTLSLRTGKLPREDNSGSKARLARARLVSHP
jgi:N-terminal domain of NWD NACHT-NTPase